LRFDVDFARAALLALIQIGLMAAVVGLAAPLLQRPPEVAAAGRVVDRPDREDGLLRWLDALAILVAAGLVLPPLTSIAWSGRELFARLDPAVGGALATSLAIAVPSAALSLLAAILITRSRVAFAGAGRPRLARLMAVAPLLAIATPPLAFASGLFILARTLGDPSVIAMPTLILVNAMMALPFVHRLVDPPLTLAAERYGRLADSVGMGGLARLRLVEWPLLGSSAGAAFAYAMALSLGDLGVVTLFGSDSLVTLPALLYEKLGAYRVEDAAGVAAILTALVLALFLVAERLWRPDAPR
jgi:thiamine transport system permease protein